MTAPPFDPLEPMLPVLDELPRQMLAGANQDALVLDPHDLLEGLALTEQEIELGNQLGAQIDPDDDADNSDSPPGFALRRQAPPAGVLSAASELRTALLDNGVPKVSIELRSDAQGLYRVNRFVRNLSHHIVSTRRAGLTPGLSLVKLGRSDLSGPLCNGYGGFDLCARIITLGYANHPGLGGPWSVPGWGTVPRDNGRPYIFGWEFEGGLYTEDWPEEMHVFMAQCNAGTLEWLSSLPGNPSSLAPLECQGEHKTWAPGRKVDRLNYTTQSGRLRVAAVRADKTEPPQEEGWLMGLSDKDQEAIRHALLDPVINGKTLATAVRELHTVWYEREHDRAGLSDEVRIPSARAIHLLRYADGNSQITREDVEEVSKKLDEVLALLQPQSAPPAV